MKTLIVLAVVGMGCVCCGQARGNNNFFLPGDAFFPARLTEEEANKLKVDSKDGPVFEYSSLGGYQSAFCGYAGYEQARFARVDEAFIKNLKRAYRHVRENYEGKKLIEVEEGGKKRFEETNGVGVLFYPPEFEFPKFALGLQYNENWVAEVEKFGHAERRMRLCCLVNKEDAVMESWRDSTIVAALKAELPKVKLEPVPETREPVIVRGPVQAFVVDSRPLGEYFKVEREDRDVTGDISVLSVDSSGITEITYHDGEWVREEVTK